ncbi:MAG TPA: hypothetical protein VM598_02030, partial [Bdellovibrionota bacterium]|nr:hypothetical protein [Bdellovibrionota bacterium]
MTSAESRFFVPDLSPIDHPEREWSKARIVFVAESPHVSEVAPEKRAERRPLCGVAGKAWWGLLSELLEGKADDDVSLERLLSFTERHGLVVMNAVQLPLDSKVMAKFPECDPVRLLGFDKGPGPSSYAKKRESAEVARALGRLADRLRDPAVSSLPVVALGNDSEWFLKRALADEPGRLIGKVPHPSAWWRQGGHFGRV